MFNTYLFNEALYNQEITILAKFFTVLFHARTLVVELNSRAFNILFHARTRIISLFRKAVL